MYEHATWSKIRDRQLKTKNGKEKTFRKQETTSEVIKKVKEKCKKFRKIIGSYFGRF